MGFISGAKPDASIVRVVSQTAFDIRNTTYEDVVAHAANWMRGRHPEIPAEALSGEPFEIAGGGASPAQAVTISTPTIQIWAARLDYPDDEVARRTWVTELTVAKQSGTLKFGTRLVNVSAGDNPPFTLTRPRIVRDAIDKFECFCDGQRLSNSTQLVSSDEELSALEDLIFDRTRILPIIAISQRTTGQTLLDSRALLGRISGTAHVFEIEPDLCTEMRRRYGNEGAVYNGAARMFRRSFNPFSENDTSHPVWFPKKDTATGLVKIPVGIASKTALSESIRSFPERLLPRFDVYRAAWSDQRQAEARSSGDDKALFALLEEDIAKLKIEKEQQKQEYDQLLQDASDEILDKDHIIADLKAELFGLSSRLRVISSGFAERGENEPEKLLDSYENVEEWSQEYLSGSIWIAPRAIKEAKRSQFEDIDLFSKTLLTLRNIYVPMRRGGESWDTYRAALSSLNLEDRPCFSKTGEVRSYPEYSVTYQGQKFWCENHIKYGGGKDPRYFFRIYYCWNEPDQILLIGHMPSHLTNNLTD